MSEFFPILSEVKELRAVCPVLEIEVRFNGASFGSNATTTSGSGPTTTPSTRRLSAGSSTPPAELGTVTSSLDGQFVAPTAVRHRNHPSAKVRLEELARSQGEMRSEEAWGRHSRVCMPPGTSFLCFCRGEALAEATSEALTRGHAGNRRLHER